MRWTASWIWIRDEGPLFNSHVLLRKEFHLGERPERASLSVTAESSYRLWVNGRFVGRGPVRSDPRHKYYDLFELAPYLEQGANCVGVEAVCWAVGSCKNIACRGGFLCQADLVFAGGKILTLPSDRSWRAKRAEAWKRDCRRVSRFQEFPDHYDARKEPLGWKEPGFDDRGWQEPEELGMPPVEPWTELLPRDIPMLTEREVLPRSVVKTGALTQVLDVHYLPFEQTFSLKATDAPYVLAYLYPELLRQEQPARKPGHLPEVPPSPAVTSKEAVRQPGYALTYLYSPSARELGLELGGGMLRKLWVNGRLLLDTAKEARVRISFHTFTCQLQKGWNAILLVAERAWEFWEAFIRADAESDEKLVLSCVKDAGEATPSWFIGARSWGILEDQEVRGEDRRRLQDELARHGIVEKDLAWKRIQMSPRFEDFPAPWYQAYLDRPAARPLGTEVELPLEPSPARTGLAIAPTEREAVFVTLDFGREVKGFLNLELEASDGAIIDLAYSERLSPDGRARHTDDTQVELFRQWIDRYVTRSGPQRWESFSWKGFRYLDLIVRGNGAPVTVRSVKLLSRSYPLQYKGSFSCSDETLIHMWKAGAYSVELCMDDAYMDCPGREQGQYWGDARVETLTNYYCFGDLALARKGILQIGQSQRDDGLTAGLYPSDHNLIMPDYSLFWINSIWDYYLYAGDEEFVQSLYPKVERLLAWFEANRDDFGLLEERYWTFLDWVPIDRKGEIALFNLIYHGALLDAVRIARVSGHEAAAARIEQAAGDLKRKINTRFWSEEAGLYVDAFKDGARSVTMSQHANALALLYDVAPPEKRQSIITGILERGDLVKPSPYFAFYVLRALAHCEAFGKVPELIKRLWSRMLEEGNATFWEDWHGRNSLCHGWASAPTFVLSAYALGVEPLSRGFELFRIRPQMADLAWARGIVPTPKGDIRMSWQRGPATYELEAEIPEGTRAEIWTPRGLLSGREVTHNGAVRTAEELAASAVQTSARYLCFMAASGTFSVRSAG